MTLKRILIAQLVTLVAVVVAVNGLALGDVRSVLFGGGISVAGNAYAAWRVFSQQVGVPDQSELFNLYRAEFGKLVIVGALCAAVFAVVDDIRIGSFLAGLLSGLLAATTAVVTQKVQLPDEEKIQN